MCMIKSFLCIAASSRKRNGFRVLHKKIIEVGVKISDIFSSIYFLVIDFLYKVRAFYW